MKSNFYLLFCILLMLGSVPTFAQIGIGTTTPAPSAALEVTSSTNNKGILIPRITASQKDAIVNPAQGLLVYQTSAPTGFYYYTGTAWKLMVTQTDLDTKISTADAIISLNAKVDKITGKDLSSNDYTSAEKTKLAAIAGSNTGDQDLSALATNTALALKSNSTDVNTSLAFKVDKIIGKELSTNDYTTPEKTKLAAIIGINTGDQTNITGNAATATLAASATKLATAKTIGGVSFDGASNIDLPGVNIAGNQNTTGNSATATKLATARRINGVDFDGSGDITITSSADAGTLTGTTLKSTVTNSSLTSVGTLTNLTVTNPITGSVTGNAATATTAGNITATTNTTLSSLSNLATVGTITSGIWSGTTIAIANGGTGATTLTGYVKGNGVNALSAVATIPSTDISGIIRTVNGSSPASDGNVSVSFGSVTTGTLASRPVNSGTNGNIYVISGDSNTSDNGRTFISDGTNWNEVTSDQSATDARYLQKSGGSLAGNVVVPSNYIITLTDLPSNGTDAVNKNYVDQRVSTSTISDADANTKGKIQLAGDLAGTASSPSVDKVGGSTASAINLATVLANGATNNNTLNTIVKRDGSGNFTAGTITANLNGNSTNVSGTVAVTNGGTGATSLIGIIKGNGTGAMTAAIAGTDYLTPSGSAASLTNFPTLNQNTTGNAATATNINATSNTTLTSLVNLNTVGTITSGVWNGTTIPVSNGGTGVTTLSGYVKGNGTNGLTAVSSIPSTDISGLIKKVNGSLPDVNGNVSITFGRVTSGLLSGRPSNSTGNNGDIYVVSGDFTSSNNGRTFIYDGTSWNETSTNLSTTDARYLQLAGGSLTGNIVVPAGNSITLTDLPSSGTGAANKNYVDQQISGASISDATTLVKGKILLAGDLAGSASSPSVTSVGGSTAASINSATILANSATTSNTTSTIVKRDASGNFSANMITANLNGNVTGNAATSTFATNSGNITATSNSTLTSLANLSTIGTITSGVWSGTAISVANGGTGATSLTGLVKGSESTALTAAVPGTDYLAPNGSAAFLTSFPTLNQSTTGNAATASFATTAGNITATSNTSLTSLSNLTAVGTITSGTINLSTKLKTSDKLELGTVTYPNVHGTNGQVLSTTGSGTLTWTTPASAGGAHTIGESYGGGVVFYVYDNGAHGLIVALTDQSTGTSFGSGLTHANRDGINAGQYNTAAIIAKIGTSAAKVCAAHTGGGFGDWYLPSIRELQLIYTFKSQNPSMFPNLPNNSANALYWASTEHPNNPTGNGYGLYIIGGGSIELGKTFSGYVRAIRAF